MAGREPFMLPHRDPVLYFIQRLRDEAHRFAIGSHRARRKKEMHANPLDEIAGVGPSRKRALLRHFGTAKAVSRAGVEDLMTVEGVSREPGGGDLRPFPRAGAVRAPELRLSSRFVSKSLYFAACRDARRRPIDANRGGNPRCRHDGPSGRTDAAPGRSRGAQPSRTS